MAASGIEIRGEAPDDRVAISQVTAAAFLAAPHTSHMEQFIVDALRRAGQLAVSRVAVQNGSVIGHIAVSPVKINAEAELWFGLGPVSVLPNYQRRGIGSALVMDAMLILSNSGAGGCVVLGDPGFYERFGFQNTDALVLPGVLPAHFMAVSFGGSIPNGIVSYHDAFQAHS